MSRRENVVKLASAATFLVLVAVAVLIVVGGGSGGGDAGNIVDAREVDRQLAGIPQRGMVLGDPGAKATLLEFADLQCPVCKGYSEEILPGLIDSQVRSGRAKIVFKNFTIIDERSVPAGAAAIAAGMQGRGWNFVETFYRNQGEERSGYVTNDFLTAIARAAGVPDIGSWNKARESKQVLGEVAASTAEAERLGFTGTPSFAVEGPGAEGLESLGGAPSAGSLESAVEQAAG
jgi:protein-disulfide isomerase